MTYLTALIVTTEATIFSVFLFLTGDFDENGFVETR